jgi:hypothetical protein
MSDSSFSNVNEGALLADHVNNDDNGGLLVQQSSTTATRASSDRSTPSPLSLNTPNSGTIIGELKQLNTGIQQLNQKMNYLRFLTTISIVS